MDNKPENPTDKVFKKRIELVSDIMQRFEEIEQYIKPLIADKNILEKITELRFKLTMMPMDDLVLYTCMIAERTTFLNMCKPNICMICGNKIQDKNEA